MPAKKTPPASTKPATTPAATKPATKPATTPAASADPAKRAPSTPLPKETIHVDRTTGEKKTGSPTGPTPEPPNPADGPVEPKKDDRDRVNQDLAAARERKDAEARARRENTALAGLPSHGDVEREIQAKDRAAHDAKKAAEPAPKPVFDPKACMRHHGPKTDDFRGLDLYLPPRVNADQTAATIDTRFNDAAKGMNAGDRASLADRYSEKIGAPGFERDPLFSRFDRTDPKEAKKASNDFRLREADRMRAVAAGLPPDQKAAATKRADELVRRPINEPTNQFLSALERTPAANLSMNDLSDGMKVVDRHKAADHDKYDRSTGLKKGHDDLFISRDAEYQLFDGHFQRDIDVAKEKMRMLNDKTCMRHHAPPKDDFKLDLRGFGSDPKDPFGLKSGKSPFLDPPAKKDALEEAIDRRLGANAADPAARAKLRAEHDQLQRIRANPGDPTARLRVDPSKLTPDQKKILEDHQAAYRLNNLEQKLKGPHDRMAAEYAENKWSPDSRFFGVNNPAFLADLANKDPKTISRYDTFRGLRASDEFRAQNPEIFKGQDGDFRTSRGGKPSDVYYRDLADIRKSYDQQLEQAKTALPPGEYAAKKTELDRQFDARKKLIEEDANNPFGFLRRPVAELDDKTARMVNADYTRYGVEKLERTLRTQAVAGVGDQVNKLDRHFAHMLDHQGIVGGGANWLKNHIGADGGWIVDSNLGSDAVKRTIQNAHVSRDAMENLKNFQGTNEDFIKAYQARAGDLHTNLRDVQNHIQKFKTSQDNWVEGVSTAVSVVGAAAAAAATGGVAAPLLVGAVVGAGVKVGVKGVDAWTGGHEYQGNIGIDLLKGGLNGVSAAGTGLLANQASKSLLASATARLAPGQTLSLTTRGGIFLGTAAGEGAVDGYISGTGNALIDGKSFAQANKEGLQGMALGAGLGPVARGSMKGAEWLWKSGVRPAGLPKDIQVDWRGRPIDGNGNILDLKKNWKGEYIIDGQPVPTTTATRPATSRALDDTVVDLPVPPKPKTPAPIDAPPQPYRELPVAKGKPDGESLTARVDGYNQVHDPHFTTGMANAIDEAQKSLDAIMKANGGKVTADQVDEVLKKVGERRQKLQHDKVDRDAAKAASEGRPWSQDQLDRAHRHADDYGRPLPEMDPARGGEMWDQVTPTNRHKAYLDRAKEAFDVMDAAGWQNKVTIDVNGVPTQVPLSVVVNNPFGGGGFSTVHPNFDNSRVLSKRAYQLMADVLSDGTMTEAQAFKKIAEANYLMMHGTPFMLGSPASIEALNDAVMRTRFGKTFPPKKPGVEPFWEAMFAPPGQPGMDKFVQAYRQFFE